MQTGYRFLEPAGLARVKNLSVVARGVVEGFISGLHSSPFKGFSVEFAEHREYTAGDDPRQLDYRMLGRTDRLYVKQYEEETNMRVQILLDTSGSMGYSRDGRLTQAPVRLLPDGRAVVPDDPAAGFGGPDHVRHGDSARHAGPQFAAAFPRDDAAARSGRARRRDRHRRDAARAGQPLQTPLPDRVGQRPVRRAGAR